MLGVANAPSPMRVVKIPRNTNVRPLRQPVLDDQVKASMNVVGGVFDPTNGFYGVIHYTGCETEERAKEIIQGLHRAAKRIGVSMSAKALREDDESWTVKYFAIDKAMARKYVLEHYGEDRSKWPYSPIKGDRNFG